MPDTYSLSVTPIKAQEKVGHLAPTPLGHNCHHQILSQFGYKVKNK